MTKIDKPTRRDILKTGAIAGAATVGVGAATGVASAGHSVSEWEFFGCSQVCVNAKNAQAVVATEGGDNCVKRPINRRSNRGNLDWDYIYCRSVGNGEAIVGIWVDGNFIRNENRCAQNYDCPNYNE